MRFNQFMARRGLTRSAHVAILGSDERCHVRLVLLAFSALRPVRGASAPFPCVCISRINNHELRVTL